MVLRSNISKGLHRLRSSFSAHVKFSKKSNKGHYIHIKDEEVANRLATKMRNHLHGTNIIIENHPGPGMLTSALLHETQANIIAWESRPEYTEHLENLPQFENGRLQVVTKSPLQRAAEYSAEATAQEWSQDQGFPLTLVHYLQDEGASLHASRMSIALLRRTGYFTHSPAQQFLLVSPREYALLVKNISELTHNIPVRIPLYRMLFHQQTISQIPAQALEIPEHAKRGKLKRSYLSDLPEDVYYLVRLVPRSSIQEDCDPSELPNLYHFTQQLWRRRARDRLIPKMEQWCPGVGLEMIKQGFTMIQMVKDLEPEDFMLLFKIMVKQPNYEDSPFKHMMLSRDEPVTKHGAAEDSGMDEHDEEEERET